MAPTTKPAHFLAAPPELRPRAYEKVNAECKKPDRSHFINGCRQTRHEELAPLYNLDRSDSSYGHCFIVNREAFPQWLDLVNEVNTALLQHVRLKSVAKQNRHLDLYFDKKCKSLSGRYASRQHVWVNN